MRVDVPVDLPDFRGDLIQETGFFHGLSELGLIDFGEGPDGEIKIDPGGMPEAIEGGEGAARDDVVDMGVILQGTTPGMKDPRNPGRSPPMYFSSGASFLMASERL